MNFLSALTAWLRSAPPPDAAVRAGLRRIAELVGPLLATERNFERKLALPVEHALSHCSALVAALPDRIDIDRPAFSANPLVHALFATADDIEAMLGSSLALRDFLAGSEALGSDFCYALLATRRHEKRILGVASTGDSVRTDVPQRLLYFSSHALAVFAGDQDSAQSRLRSAAFDSLLKSFAAQISDIRAEQDDLHHGRELDKTRLLALRGRIAAPERERHTRHLAALDVRLRSNAEALMPGCLIEALAAFLMEPHEALRIEPFQARLDRGGILAGEDTLPAGEVSAIEFAELISRDRRKHVVVPVRIRRDDAVLAIDRARHDRGRLLRL